MKKLFALAIVASMALISCNNAPKETEEVVEGEAIEQTQEQQEQPTAEMTEEAQEETPAE